MRNIRLAPPVHFFSGLQFLKAETNIYIPSGAKVLSRIQRRFAVNDNKQKRLKIIIVVPKTVKRTKIGKKNQTNTATTKNQRAEV